jgi:hypothetical protein
MSRIKDKSVWLLLPVFANELIGGESSREVKSFGEVVGSNEVVGPRIS